MFVSDLGMLCCGDGGQDEQFDPILFINGVVITLCTSDNDYIVFV